MIISKLITVYAVKTVIALAMVPGVAHGQLPLEDVAIPDGHLALERGLATLPLAPGGRLWQVPEGATAVSRLEVAGR